MNISKRQVKWVILLCSVSTYILSLFLPALLQREYHPIFGNTVLAFGWLGILDFESFAWLANPAYHLAIFAYVVTTRSNAKRAKINALLRSVIALLLGLTSFYVKTWPVDEGPGSQTPITGLGIGFYVWMLSFVILLVGCFIPSSLNTPTPFNEGTSS